MRKLHICRTMLLYDDRIWGLLERDWTNVLYSVLPYPRTAAWIAHDLRRGLPFGDREFGAAFVPHTIEHVTREQAARLASELHRVLTPGAVLRLSTNDLERAARQYLDLVTQAASAPDGRDLVLYDWSVYELIDQITRDQTGGEMLKAFRRGDYDETQLRERFGLVFPSLSWPARKPSAGLAPDLVYGALRKLRRSLTRGDPRRTVERTGWLWDRVSLSRLLTEAGFVDYRVVSEAESAIPGWELYDFDRTEDGRPLEPSVYVEAVRAPDP